MTFFTSELTSTVQHDMFFSSVLFNTWWWDLRSQLSGKNFTSATQNKVILIFVTGITQK